MRKLPQIKKPLLLFTSLSLGLLPLPLLNEQPASAGCGFGDITCNPKKWTCPPGGCGPVGRPSNNGSQSTVGCPHCQSKPQQAVNIFNATSQPVYYQLDGQNFSLAPKYGRTHYTTNNSVDIGFDYSYDSGYQGMNYRLNANSNYRFESSGGNNFNIYRY